MNFSLYYVLIFLWGTYSNQLDTSVLLVKSYFIQKQERSLRDYFQNIKDGVIIFKSSTIQKQSSTPIEVQDQDSLFYNSSFVNLFNKEPETTDSTDFDCSEFCKRKLLLLENLTKTQTSTSADKKSDLADDQINKSLTLNDVIMQVISVRDVVIFTTQIGAELQETAKIEVSYQNITFEHEEDCHMLTFRNVTHLEKLQEQQKQLEIIDSVTATVAHNMITPLKSISLLAKKIAQNRGLDNIEDANLVYSTSQLLLAEVMLLLDRNQLQKERFKPNLTSLSVNKTIQSTVSLLQLQSQMQQVKIKLEKLPNDVILDLDAFRT